MTDTVQQFDTTIDLQQAILWQYNEALRLQALLQDKQDWYQENQVGFWTDFYADIFDLRTCNYFGLCVWAIILGQPIIFPNVSDPDRPTWGFDEFHRNFERGNFANAGGFTYVLSPETARVLLRLRYYQLTGTCCVPSINRALADVFADYGPAWVNDLHNMTQFYTFGFALPSDMNWLFTHYDVLPRPAGVGSDFRVIVEDAWGFDEDHENFDNGNFSEE